MEQEEMFPDETELSRIEAGDMESLIRADECGLFPAPDETAPEFAQFIRFLKKTYEDFSAGLAEGKDLDDLAGFKVGKGVSVGPELIEETAEQTKNLFQFQIDWVPAFFLSDGLGLLWGGCTVVTEQQTAMFFIRKDFETRKHWFVYDRSEILAHEICHVARGRLNDFEFDEHFAYMTATSRLRQRIGNCFRRDMDAFLFTVPVLILVVIQFLISFEYMRLPALPFWLAAAVCPLWLLIRNFRSRKVYQTAADILRQCGIREENAVLSRCTGKEIHEIAQSNAVELPNKLRRKAENELRWQIILTRFPLKF